MSPAETQRRQEKTGIQGFKALRLGALGKKIFKNNKMKRNISRKGAETQRKEMNLRV